MPSGAQVRQEKEFYDRRWRSAELSAAEQERIASTLDALPRSCMSVLDVGCGDGRLTERMRQELGVFVVGCDLSTVALARIEGPRCCGSARQLPFSDQSFDLVVATEMLEHLPAATYLDVLPELARVARNYVLITVPNEENLKEVTGRCGACGRRFHVWGHVRSFQPHILRRLFPGFEPVRIVRFGSPVGLYNRLLLWIRHHVAGAWYWESNTVCFNCHSEEQAPARLPFLARFCDFLNFRFWALHFKRESWLLGLYAKKRP